MKIHIEVSLDTEVDFSFYGLNPNDPPDVIRQKLQDDLQGSRRDLYEEITCAGQYNVTVS